MPILTRRRNPDRHDCWQIYYGDVHVGTISIRAGIPHDQDSWGWSCGFYPGSQPAEHITGTAATFEAARVGFEAAWRVFLPKRTEADFQTWRDDRAWQARKRAMWQRGEQFASQKPNSLVRCACGETFDSQQLAHT